MSTNTCHSTTGDALAFPHWELHLVILAASIPMGDNYANYVCMHLHVNAYMH